MKKYYFTMKTTNEILKETRRRIPLYLSEMNEVAIKYKNVVIAFDVVNNTYGTFYRPTDTKKYGKWIWHRDFLAKEKNMQLELAF